MDLKTPVSLLHEVCTKNSFPSSFDLVQIEGSSHEPIFGYCSNVQVKGAVLKENGTGRNKKEAKHNAARSMLLRLKSLEMCIVGLDNVESVTQTCDNDAGNGGPGGDAMANPVGVLQELCMKLKLKTPEYTVHSEEGLPHERMFAIACHVGDQHVEIGRGKSKKLAKRVSARLMAERLRSLPLDGSMANAFDEDDYAICKVISQIKQGTSFRNSKHTTFANVEKSLNMFRILQSIPDEGMKNTLDSESVNGSCDSFIKQVEKDLKCSCMTIKFEEKTLVGEYQCLAQLTTEPPIAFFGTGDTKERAKQNAIEDLKRFLLNIFYEELPEECLEGRDFLDIQSLSVFQNDLQLALKDS